MAPQLVFISHSSTDREVALALCEALENAGVRCWIAPRDILEGAEWDESITQAVDDSSLVVLVLSQRSNQSDEVVREIKGAARRKIPVIPFRIEDIEPATSLDYVLANAQRLDAFEPPLDDHVIRLVQVVRRYLSANGATAPRATAVGVLRPLARITAASALLFALVGFLLLRIDFLGATGVTERYSYDLLNQVLAPLYPTAARDRMSVVLITDEALDVLGEPWPASYGFHAQILNSLLVYKPRAVMIDLLFKDRRVDGTLPELERALQRYQKAAIPVYAAAASSKPDAIRSELAPLVTAVPVPKHADRYDRAQRQYPLLLPGYASVTQTAALRIYTDLERGGNLTSDELTEEFERPMRILWGTQPPSEQSEWIACRKPPASVGSAVWGRLFGGVDTIQTDCFYTPTLLADHVFTQSSNPRTRNLLEGNVVFYGAALQGADDSVYPPTHSRLPGVFMHAMALDNLVTFGSEYMREPAPGSRLSQARNLLEVFVLAVYGVMIGFRDWTRSFLRMRRGRARSAVDSDIFLVAALTVAGLMISALFSLAVARWAFEALHIAPINWLGCLAAATTVMLVKDWAVRFGHRSRLLKG